MERLSRQIGPVFWRATPPTKALSPKRPGAIWPASVDGRPGSRVYLGSPHPQQLIARCYGLRRRPKEAGTPSNTWLSAGRLTKNPRLSRCCTLPIGRWGCLACRATALGCLPFIATQITSTSTSCCHVIDLLTTVCGRLLAGSMRCIDPHGKSKSRWVFRTTMAIASSPRSTA
jgi:hypothetical protein